MKVSNMDQSIINILDNVSNSEFKCPTDIRMTYRNYIDLVDGLAAKCVNIQNTLPVILKEIDDEFRIPQKISNLTRKVRSYVLKNQTPEKLDILIPDLISTQDLLHPDLKSMGNELNQLLQGGTFKVKAGFELKNKHVLNLRRIVTLHSVPWKQAAAWVSEIQGTKFENEHSIRSQWNRLYEVKKRLRLHPSDFEYFCDEIYKGPTTMGPSLSSNVVNKTKCSTGTESVVDNRTAEVLRSMYNKLIDYSDKMTNLTEENVSLNEKIKNMADLKQKYNKQMKEINDLKVKLTELKPRNTSRKIQRRDMKLDKMEAKLKQKEQQIDVKNREFLNQQQQIDQLETELATLRKEKLNLQKAKSYYKQKGERVKQKDVDKTLVKEMKETIKTLENENAVLREQVDEALEGHKKISVFHNGKYDDAIRLVYIDLLQMGVSIKNCQNVVKSVLSNLMHVEIDRLPQKTLATLLTVEAQILAQAQAAEEILQCENATLHLDGTKKHFEEYSGFQISVGGGRSFSLGHQLMATGDTDSYIEATVNTVEELASALTDDENEKKTYVANLMMKIKNLMTDRHIVNKCYQHKFENLRKQYGEEIIDNWDTLTEDEKNKTAEVNGLFCGLHVIINMASASLKGLKEFEDHNEIVNNYNQQSAASELIRACAKAFMVTSGDEKSGDALEFKHFLDSMEQKFHFITFKHNRFNVLFHDAGAMYFHCKHVLEYLSSGRTSKCNKLLTAIHNGCENERILSECRALGLVGKLICGPLWRLLEDQNTSFFEMNEHWLQLKVFLEQYQKHPEDLLKGNQTFRGASIDKDEVYEKLIEPNAQYDKPTLEAIQSICRAMLPVITRQLEDQLPGGKYDNPSADLVQETSTAPLTNRLSEADFSDLDRSVNQAPQKGKASRSGTICYKRNKTKEYLKTLTKSKKEKYMKIARNLAKERAAQDGVKTLAVRKQRLLLQAKRIEKKEAAKQKKAERQNNIREKLECEGVWTSYNIVSERLDGLSRTKKVQKIKDQILGHKLILKSNISDKSLFSWTKNKRNLTVAELQENLVAIINEVFQTHIPDTVHAINSIAPSAPVHTVQKRQMKRVCTHSKSAKSKKIKTVAVEKFKTGTFYAVAFENTWYPGECIQIESDTEATLKYLTHKGSLFQWPSREDVMVTNIKAVLCETEISPVCGGRLWNVTNKSEISSIFKDH